MLRLYVADDCSGSPMAWQRVARLHDQASKVSIEIIDVGVLGTHIPPAVFGTPTYTWYDRILFLGNPSEQELLERVRILYERAATGNTTR